jgi:hypothetical protein
MSAWVIRILLWLSLVVATPAIAQSNMLPTHRLGSGEIRTTDGHLVETLSKSELVCLVYLMWWYESQSACAQTEPPRRKTPQGWCGEDLKPKAEACQLTN